jgi:hypothetical protein
MTARRRFTRGLSVLAILASAGLAGCASASARAATGALPPDLPTAPQPGARYCRVLVPPTYRDVPTLVCEGGGCEKVAETVMETRLREVCIRPRQERIVCLPGKSCEQTVVQTRPGGYRWVERGGCWEYCYMPPCYQWCERTVTEEGIRYCAETPPVYRTVAETVPVTRYRSVYVPPKYKVRWVKELYRPASWEWQMTPGCGSICPEPCPKLETVAEPCRPVTIGVGAGCPACH